MPQNEYSQEQYETDFYVDKGIREKALERALDTRKFEIELYWKRAAYFWTFIGAALAGFLAVQASEVEAKRDLSVVLSCVGFVFSVAWFCVNRGSKYWPENWEKHVDLLEDKVSGPLYKVVLVKRVHKGPKAFVNHFVAGSSPLSVSKINQLISLYVSILWGVLVWYSLPEFRIESDFNLFYCAVVGLSLAACITFFLVGRTNQEGPSHRATIRTAEIKDG